MRADAGVVGPGRERAGDLAKGQAGEDEQRDDDGTGPASAQVGKLGDGLGEDQLIGVALKVAQDRGPKMADMTIMPKSRELQ